MRHLMFAAFMVIAALGITSFTASALQGWATAQRPAYDEPATSDVAKQDPKAKEVADPRAVRQGRSRELFRDRSVAGT